MEKLPKFKKVPVDVPVSDLTPMNVTCGTTKCEEDLHCYSKKKASIRKQGKKGVCKECGDEGIDWSRIHKNDSSDTDFIFASMRKELIRQVFFQAVIDEKAMSRAKKLGKSGLKVRAEKLLRQRIGKLSAWDGRQVPMGDGDVINYAQHATGTCCRNCLEAWHNIPRELDLNDQQVKFCTELVMSYIDVKLPQLPDAADTSALKQH